MPFSRVNACAAALSTPVPFHHMATTAPTVTDICVAAQAASRKLAQLAWGVRDAPLLAIADGLRARVDEILEANARELEAGREAGIPAPLLDRLALNPERVKEIADGARQIAALRDPVGEVIEGWRLENGLDVHKVRVPLGV